jgi:hypothetical protein
LSKRNHDPNPGCLAEKSVVLNIVTKSNIEINIIISSNYINILTEISSFLAKIILLNWRKLHLLIRSLSKTGFVLSQDPLLHISFCAYTVVYFSMCIIGLTFGRSPIGANLNKTTVNIYL